MGRIVALAGAVWGATLTGCSGARPTNDAGGIEPDLGAVDARAPSDAAELDARLRRDGALDAMTLPLPELGPRDASLPCEGAVALRLLSPPPPEAVERTYVQGRTRDDGAISLLWRTRAEWTGPVLWQLGRLPTAESREIESVADLPSGHDGLVLLAPEGGSERFLDDQGRVLALLSDGTLDTVAQLPVPDGATLTETEACGAGTIAVRYCLPSGRQQVAIATVDAAGVEVSETLDLDYPFVIDCREAPPPFVPELQACSRTSTGVVLAVQGATEGLPVWLAAWDAAGRSTGPTSVALETGRATARLWSTEAGTWLFVWRSLGDRTQDLSAFVMGDGAELVAATGIDHFPGMARPLAVWASGADAVILYSTRLVNAVRFSPGGTFGTPAIVTDLPCQTSSPLLSVGAGLALPVECFVGDQIAILTMCGSR